MDSKLQEFVKEGLKEDQSPAGLSGRLKYVRKDLQYSSTKAIYKFVYSPNGRQIEKYLYSTIPNYIEFEKFISAAWYL